MKHGLEICIFVAVALIFHLLAFARAPQSGVDSAGRGGEAPVSIQAAAPTVVEMVETWERPRQTEPEPPNQPASPEVPASDTPARPQLELDTAPRAAALIAIAQPQERDEITLDFTPPPPPPEPEPAAEPAPEVRPKIRPPAPQPEPKEARKADQATAGRVGQKSAGAGGGQQAGASTTNVATALSGKNAKLTAIWGAKIQARIERHKKYPRGTEESGNVGVELSVSRGGQLLNYQVIKSSGVAILDQAALNAVVRAKKFPKAPKELAGDSFRFRVNMTLKRRR